MKMLRIFIADADQDVRVSMQMLLDREPGMRVVGISVRSEGLVGQVGAAQPDVVLLDWKFVESAPVEYINYLQLVESQPDIIVLHVRSEIRYEAEAAGAEGFVSKDGPPDQLLTILRKLKQERDQEQEMME
jgi:DNA-binding NarL/FixJ family response regulator